MELYSTTPSLNVGGNIALNELSITGSKFAVLSKDSEEALFRDLNARLQDNLRVDQENGEDHKLLRGLEVVPNASEAAAYTNRAQVVYMGIIVTYEERNGRKHRVEACVYLQDGPRLPELCSNHNRSY